MYTGMINMYAYVNIQIECSEFFIRLQSVYISNKFILNLGYIV